MTTISVVAEKGGVGKTTTVLELAYQFQIEQKKVLVIDLDPQGSVTSVLTGKKNFENSVIGLFESEELVVLKSFIQKALSEWGNIYVIPGDRRTSNLSSILSDRVGRDAILSQQIKSAKKLFDYILIDTPPSLGIGTMNALTASDYFLITTEASRFGSEAIPGVTKLAKNVKEKTNSSLELLGVIINGFQKGISKGVRESVQEIKSMTKNDPILIPHSTKIIEAQRIGASACKLFPNTSVSKSYVELAKQIEERIEA